MSKAFRRSKKTSHRAFLGTSGKGEVSKRYRGLPEYYDAEYAESKMLQQDVPFFSRTTAQKTANDFGVVRGHRARRYPDGTSGAPGRGNRLRSESVEYRGAKARCCRFERSRFAVAAWGCASNLICRKSLIGFACILTRCWHSRPWRNWTNCCNASVSI